jgi:hypothetical protein
MHPDKLTIWEIGPARQPLVGPGAKFDLETNGRRENAQLKSCQEFGLSTGPPNPKAAMLRTAISEQPSIQVEKSACLFE